MKKVIGLFLVALIFSSFVFAETIILKSGKKVEGKIIERTDNYVRIDFYDVPLTYYLENIKSIDGKKITQPPKQASKEKDYSYEEPEPETSYQTEKTHEQKERFDKDYSYTQDKKRDQLSSQTKIDIEKTGTKGSGIIVFFPLLIGLLIIVSLWRVFSKTGQPGWACIVPIYNLYIMVKITDKPGWWLLLLLIPFVNFIISIILYIEIAKKFGKGAGFGIGLVLLPIVFFPILAFSDAQYIG